MRGAAPERAVHVGDDGWLFLIGGTNKPLRSYNHDPIGWLRLLRWRRRIEQRWRRCQRDGVVFLQTVVPEKLTIYDDRAPTLGIRAHLSPASRLAGLLGLSRAGGAFLDLVGPMRAARDEVDLFHRTDSHWSFAGCHLAYRLLCRALGADLVPDLAERPLLGGATLGDLGSKLDPPRAEAIERRWMQRDAVIADENALSRAMRADASPSMKFVGTRTVFVNGRADADPRRLVLFGDSFAETLPTRLTGMLAETFREVHFVWSTSVDWRYVETVRPDILLCELAERFLTRVPDDRFDVARISSAA